MLIPPLHILPTQHHTHTHTHPFNGPFSGTTQVSWYQKGKTNLDFIEARDSEWQWHQLGHMQVCTLLQTDNHASNPPLSFLQPGCPSCRPTNSVKAPLWWTTQHHASVILAMSHCLLCLSQVRVILTDVDESSWFLASRLFSTYLILCCKETQVHT